MAAFKSGGKSGSNDIDTGLQKKPFQNRSPLKLGVIYAATFLLGACSVIDRDEIMAVQNSARAGIKQSSSYQHQNITAVQFAQQDDNIDDLFGYDANADEELDDLDPIEPFNRFMFAINETLDTFILKPVAVTYKTWTPELLQEMVGNLVRHLYTPLTLVNDLAQGELDRAENTASRLVINTAFGLGVLDPATKWGYPYHEEDFGQTLGSYGIGPGAYVVLPFFGPSTARDTVGLGVDYVTDPIIYLSMGLDADWITYSRAAGRAVNFRTNTLQATEELYRDALDPYVRVRSVYLQAREAKVRNEETPANPLVAQEIPQDLRVAPAAGGTSPEAQAQ